MACTILGRSLLGVCVWAALLAVHERPARACIPNVGTGGPSIDCEDGNPCTVDICSGGVCVVHAPISCTSSACATRTCVGTDGTATCNTVNKNQGLACDDGNACTYGETCSAGVCGGGTTINCAAQSTTCVTKTCNGTSTCASTNTTAACDDGNLCTTTDVCAAGTCAGSAVAGCCNMNSDCDDKDACTTDVCSGTGGTCSHPPLAACCNTDADCHGGNACAVEKCTGPGGVCKAEMAAPGAPCDHIDACSSGGFCDAAGGCQGGTGLPDGTPCDRSGCTEETRCYGGTCHCGSPDMSVGADTPDAGTGSHGDGGCSASGQGAPIGVSFFVAAALLAYVLRRRLRR